MICPNCGKDVMDGKFCTNCGCAMPAPAPVAAPDPMPVVPPTPAPQPEPTPAPQYEPAQSFEQPTFDSAPNYNEGPSFDSAPNYNEGPSFDSATNYNEGPSYDSVPHYQDVPPYDFEPEEPKKADGMAIASLVLGILGFFLPILWIVCAILAIVFGKISLNKRPVGNGLAKAGMICGIIALILGILTSIACVACNLI
ncbi:MAG: DUF4190 domain-containing protein [Lachnospiraceae bacterium]|nr:DUF4190 domain-containing protein [Lachnospiraceae bacterium]